MFLVRDLQAFIPYVTHNIYIMKTTSDFSERIKELLIEHNMTCEQLAKNIGVSRTSCYRWTLEPLQITRQNLILVADYFNCSIEFLIGRTDNTERTLSKPIPNFYTQVKKIMNEVGFTTYSLRKKSKYNGGYFYRWRNGAEPLLPTLLELANLFDCTIDYLVGRE